ncbi:MAG: hypothetical protein ACRCWI_06390 [Brevinema sp.]
MLRTEQSQQLILSQTMNLNLSILQMNRIALNIFIEEATTKNPLLASKNNNLPWKNTPKSYNVLEDILAQEKSLFSSLREELIFELDESELPILYLITGNLSPAGFLLYKIDKLCQELSIDTHRAEEIRQLIMKSSYLGLATYDDKEYLLFMTQHLYTQSSIEYQIASLLTQYRGTLNLKKLQQHLPNSKEELAQAFQNIKKISISPLNTSHTQTIYPDFIISVEKEQLIIKSSPFTTPSIYIQDYQESQYSIKELKLFLKGAKSIKKALELRERSLYKHAEALILARSDFFLDGLNSKQTRLKDIAKITHRHVSTVSRTLRHRYFYFNNQIYPFSILWTHNIGNSDSYTVKKIIQQLITYENQQNPLSDIMISEILKKKGIKIARRTVSKYRQELQIDSSYQR